MVRLIKESFKGDQGEILVLYVMDNSKVLKYRIVYRGNNWSEDEWVRLDHKKFEPHHIHVRRRTTLIRYEKASLLDIFNMLHDLSDRIVGVVQKCGRK